MIKMPKIYSLCQLTKFLSEPGKSRIMISLDKHRSKNSDGETLYLGDPREIRAKCNELVKRGRNIFPLDAYLIDGYLGSQTSLETSVERKTRYGHYWRNNTSRQHTLRASWRGY